MYVLAPYERRVGPGGRPARRCALARILPDQKAGGTEPFVEAEGLGGFAVALIVDDDLRAQAAAAPGILAFPKIPLTATLGEVNASTRSELRDAAAAMGYTMAEIRQALGTDLASVTLLRLLRFMVSRRRRPRYDPDTDSIVLDGAETSTSPLPLPLIAGAAFPTQALLEIFTAADGTTPPSGSWTNNVYGSSGHAIRVVGNQGAINAGNTGTAWWSAATFGPDVEAYMDVPTLPTGYAGVILRLQTPGVIGTLDDYEVYLVGATQGEIDRTENGTGTQLGATISQTWSNGDSLGGEVIGSTITMYRKTGGTWSSVANRSDSNVTAAGFVGFYLENSGSRIDNFGGGTVGAARPVARRRMRMGMGR